MRDKVRGWTYGVAIGDGWTRDCGHLLHAMSLARKAVWGGATVATVSRYRDTPDGFAYVAKVVREGGVVVEYEADGGPQGQFWVQA